MNPARTRLLAVATVALGSFLLFLVQPMVARVVLPTLGGAPNVWNTAMLFYQAALLVGYAYAHLLQRAPVRAQAAVHLAVFALAALTLPIGVLAAPPAPTDDPNLWLLTALAAGIGPLFVAVAAQAPLMQAWAARAGIGDPYPLYAASNAGSLTGLLAYPFLLEPFARLGTQTGLWSALYVALAVLVALLARAAVRAPAPAPESVDPGPAIPLLRRLRWVALAAVPSGLMLSTTTHITTDIMAMPLLWVIPLSIYLISFIIAFGSRGASATRLANDLAPWMLIGFATLGFLTADLIATLHAFASLALLLVIAVALHGRLAQDRPPPARLTGYYLLMSVGGALGGLFCALVAPTLFDWTYEHWILLVAAALLVRRPAISPTVRRLWAHPSRGRLLRVLPVPLALAIAWWIGFSEPFTLTWLLAILVVMAFAALSIGRPMAFACQVAMLMLSVGLLREIDQSARPLVRERSFFGVTTIEDTPRERRLVHGTTLHGVQSKAPGRETEPLSYYAPLSGVGRTLTAAPALYPNARIGFVGLGTGTLSCYARPGQRWTAYEIDEAVVEIARDPRRFSYVSRCKPDLAVVLGDARAQLRATPPASFDVLAIDAFSSDAIPLHLLTREALDTYARALAPEGVLLIHVSNRYLRLAPVVSNIAAAMGWRARDLSYSPGAAGRARGYTGSQWIALARTDATLDRLAAAGGDWRRLEPDASEPTWTDDFASILPILKPLRIPGVNA